MKTALDLTTEHWWDNARLHNVGKPYGLGSQYCALCIERALTADDTAVCQGAEDVPMCPIMQHTGSPGCKGSPWALVLLRVFDPVVFAWWLEDLRAGRQPPLLLMVAPRGWGFLGEDGVHDVEAVHALQDAFPHAHIKMKLEEQ